MNTKFKRLDHSEKQKVETKSILRNMPNIYDKARLQK